MTLAGLCPAAGAQSRPARVTPPIRIGVTIATPPAPRPTDGMHRGAGQWSGDDRRAYGWGTPLLLERDVTVPVPVAVPVPYPVPYYVRGAAAEPRPAPVPYDPTRASMRIIGSGADGGAGVLRTEALAGDSLRLVWLGSARPVREARLFVANDTYQPLRSRVLGAGRREVHLSLRGLARPVAYAGVTVVHDDGSTITYLVPTSPLTR